MDDNPLETSEDTESSQVLSNLQENRGAQKRRRSEDTTFMTNKWLDDYFEHIKDDGKTKIKCRACNQIYSSRCHKRMIRHVSSKCTESVFDESQMLEEIDLNESRITQSFIRALIAGNWSFNSVETQEFKEFISGLTRKWKAPSRQDISAIYIPKYSRDLFRDFIDSLKSSGNMSITIMFDHWDDANHRSFLGIIATQTDGKRFLLDIRDVSLKGHYASVIVEELAEVLEQLPAKAINSIVSDSASTCKRARQDFVLNSDFKHVIHHRCMAHLMNLIGTRITVTNESITDTIKSATKATGIISNSVYWTNYIKDIHHKRPQSACPVRWYSTVTMLTALVDLQDVIVEKIIPEMDEIKAKVFLDIDWNYIREILAVLNPICECIGQVERKDISLGEGIKCILDYSKQLFDDDYGNHGDYDVSSTFSVITAARKAFLHYFNEEKLGREEFGLYIAAYAMDRRYKFDFMTDEAFDLCFESLARIAVKTGASLDQVSKALYLEFQYYKEYAHGFGMTNERPTEWWTERANCGLLSGVGLRLAHLKASSANIERTFSTIKFIQGDYRLNMSRDTLLHSARARVALRETSNSRQELLQQDEELATRQMENLALNDSTRCDDMISTITLPDAPSWLEDQDISTKKNYQSFSKYINLSKINESVQHSQPVIDVTEDQIRDCVRETLHARIYEPVIVDSYSQMQEIDEIIIDTDEL